MRNSKPLPPPAPKTKTQRALDAYASELRRYERKLLAWSEDLEAREADLASVIENECDGDPYLVEDECDCGPQDALDGCECETCGNWQDAHKATMAYENSDAKAVNDARAAGDELDWLEKLHGLKDKRK